MELRQEYGLSEAPPGKRRLDRPAKGSPPAQPQPNSSSSSSVHCSTKRDAPLRRQDRAEVWQSIERSSSPHPASDSHSIVRHHEEVEHRVRPVGPDTVAAGDCVSDGSSSGNLPPTQAEGTGTRWDSHRAIKQSP
ncbi:hypothetical protein EVAR_87411_1 [Eumeta japonica]|uniref:Uncharacterized protein n=1 Tax=Eumeta variegata TaxID=151549 RepID=A0A4C1XL79_EUMVA|nr:hypothetical protein EVAR_87411_1 [Eumeta japonica]